MKTRLAGELFDRLMVLGAELLVDTIDKLDTITPQPQNDAEAIHAPMIRKEMGRNRLDAARRARARPCARFEPVAVRVFTLEGKRMKLHRTKVVVGKGEPGEIAVIGGEMAVCCGENAVQLIEIQPENGKRMRGQRLSARPRDRSKGEGSVIWRLLPEKRRLRRFPR